MIDIVLGGILAWSVFTAARSGLIKEATRITALVVAVFASMWGYGLVAGYLQPWLPNTRVAAIVAFGLIFLVCVVSGALLGSVLSRVWQFTGLGWLDGLLGAGFGFLRGILACTALLLVLLGFQPFPSVSEAMARSRVAPWALSLGRTAVQMAPGVFRESYTLGVQAVERMAEEGKDGPAESSESNSGET